MPQNDTGPTLTNVSRMGRIAVKYGSLLIVLLIVGRVSINAFIAYWKATHPPPPPPPTVGFGRLPQLQFPSDTDRKPVTYRLELPNSRLPTFSDRAKVFLIPKSTPNLLADQRAKSVAARLGFNELPEVLDSQRYRFNKNQPLQATLDLNIQNLSFTIRTDYLARPELLVRTQLPTNFDAINRVKSFLSASELLPDDTATASGEVSFLKSLGGELEPAVSISDADFLQVNINRTPIDGVFRTYTPEGLKGTISAIIAGVLQGATSIVDMRVAHNTVDYNQVHTYPLRPIATAWQLLQSGEEGYIAQKGQGQEAIVRRVTLGYYDDTQEQAYLQPIYVFENPEDGFLAYISALDPQFVQTAK